MVLVVRAAAKGAILGSYCGDTSLRRRNQCASRSSCAMQALLPELQDAWAEACPLLLGATANALESSFTSASFAACWLAGW